MKREDFLNKLKDKGKPLVTAFCMLVICYFVLLGVIVVHNFFGMNLLGQFFSCLTLLILFVLAGKVIFNVDYADLLKEIKQSKCDLLDNLLITMFFSSIFGFIAVLIYHIDFMIDPDKTKTIDYFIQSITVSNTYTKGGLDYVPFLIMLVIGVAGEEVFFRYTAYRIFVKKKEDVKIFIILNSIVFAFYHDLSFSPRFFATVVIAIFLSIIYVVTKSVVYAFISHVLWDWSTAISPVFLVYFKDMNTSMITAEVIILESVMIVSLVLLVIYSYFKRGYILSPNIRNKIHGVKSIV